MNRGGRAFWSCVWTLAVVAGVSAYAKEATAETSPIDYTEFNLDELMAMDVVSGASSYDQKISDAPAAVTVITADEIHAHGYRTLADVLASVRGFNIAYDRSYSYVGVRGFGRPGDYNTRVLILHDGHPGNDIIYGTASIGPELAVDLALIKRIEIIRGPGSALYGAGAFLAVINLVTYNGDELGDGEQLGDGEIAVEYGSREHVGGRVTWGGGSPQGSLLLSAGGFRDEGDDIHWPEYDDPSTNNGLFVDGDQEKVGHLYGKYRRDGLQATAAWVRRDKRIPTGEWDMIFNDNGAECSDERLALDLSATHEISPVTSLRGRLSYDDYIYSGIYPYDYAAPGDPLDRVIEKDTAHGRWWSGELRWASVFGGRHRVVAGADFRKSTAARQRYEAVDPYEEYLSVEQEMDNAGVYVQDEWSLGRSASLYLGLRHDSYSSFGGHLTPRCGLVTHLDARTTAKLLYGEAFRAPNAFEMYYEDRVTQKANPELEPERIRTWEAVLERELGDDLLASLSVFDNEISQLIEQTVDAADTLIVFANVGDARTWGVELDLDARLLDGLRGRFSVSAQRAEDDATGTLLTNAPTHLVKLNLSTPRLARTLAGALEFQYVSRRATLAGNYAPDYAVVNLDLTWWPPVEGLQADLALDNALDQRYADPGAEHQLQDTLARPGRRMTARLGWRW